MEKSIQLHTPLRESEVRELRAGQTVYLEGMIYCVSGIDVHKRLIEYSKKHKKIPVDLHDSVIIHAPAFCQKRNGIWKLVYLTVTTSARMNLYEPDLIKLFSIRGIVGKGGMDERTHEALMKKGGVYLAQVGGCNAFYLPKADEKCEVYWEEFFPFALVQIHVHQYGPLIVAMDSHGNNLYAKTLEKGRRAIARLMG